MLLKNRKIYAIGIFLSLKLEKMLNTLSTNEVLLSSFGLQAMLVSVVGTCQHRRAYTLLKSWIKIKYTYLSPHLSVNCNKRTIVNATAKISDFDEMINYRFQIDNNAK